MPASASSVIWIWRITSLG